MDLGAGSLLELLEHSTDRALAKGALQPIPSSLYFVRQAGVRFQVHLTQAIRRKERQAAREAGNSNQRNPFLPCDRDLLVAGIGPDHLCLLNKFNVFERHLLLVTRTFQHQDSPLDLADMLALVTCLAELDGLAFYNGGRVAGASQMHKHLQLVPFPLGPDPRPPLESLFTMSRRPPTITRSPHLPFAHALLGLPPPSRHRRETARALLEAYETCLEATGVSREMGPKGELCSTPYNLLLTRRWMLLVPRRKEHFGTISVNSLGFAGTLLARGPGELSLIREAGPMEILRAVALR